MNEKVISCIQCDGDFEFSLSEQEFFAKKGFDEPKRCPECRKKKKSHGRQPDRELNPASWKKRRHQDQRHRNIWDHDDRIACNQ